MRYRLAVFSACVAAACLFSVYMDFLPPVFLGLFFFCAVLLLWRLTPQRALPRLIALGFAVGFLWFAAYSAAVYAPAAKLEYRTIRLEAVVTGWSSETAYGVSVPIRGGEANHRQSNMSIYLDVEFSSLRPGDRLACVARCTPASTTNRAKGVYLYARAYGEVTVTPADRISPRYYPAYLSRSVQETISTLYNTEGSALLQALMLGDKEQLDASASAAFSRSGLSHVVAISGMHISYLAGALALLFGRDRKWAVALQIFVIFFFAIMTGSGPGALRAAMLCAANLIAPLLGRKTEPLTSLFGALLVLLILNPFSIAGIGLQLSFAATFGIYLIATPLYNTWQEKLPQKGRRLTALPLSVLSVTLGAMLFTTPLTALYFEQVSLIAPFANLVTNWAVTLSFLGGILSVFLAFLWLPLGALLALVVRIPIAFFLACARLLGTLPFGAITLDSVYYKAFLVFLYVIMFLYILLWRKGRRRVILPACSCTIALCLCILLTGLSAQNKQLQFTVLDVGQGQCILLSSGTHRVMIDCGGSWNAGTTAANELYSFGYDYLDLLVLTHYDNDHVGGVSQLMEQVTVVAIALPDVSGGTIRTEIENLAMSKGTQLWYIQEETQVAFGHGALTIFPPVGLSASNELGLSVLCRLSGWGALVTGDMDSDTEAQLLRRFSLPEVDLLVLGHHGSKYSTSEALLEAITPEIAIASAGLNNRYGHPAEETLERLSDHQITVYRTDLAGNIRVSVRQ